MERSQVYKLIDSERDYQDNKWPDIINLPVKGVSEFVVMLNHYITVLNAEWTTNAGDTAALEVIRKIAGITVNCMEKHETKPRT